MNPYRHVKDQYPKVYEAFEQLNDYQKAAVVDQHRILLLNAHVGSGKTTVLLHKILYWHLIYQLPLERLFALTFTNKAADELLERFKEFGVHYTDQAVRYFGTFHSLARKLLEHHLPLDQIGYQKGFTILSEEDRFEYINRLIALRQLTIKYPKRVIKRIERYKKEGQTLYGVMKYEDDLETLVSLLSKEKANDNVMSFDDLIDYSVSLLESNPALNLCDAIIIDEFQDSDTQQLQLIQLLTDSKTNLFAVGDPNQTIYTWRGSNPRIFDDFQRKTNAHTMSLPINYRSKSSILDVAKVFLDDQHPEEIKGNRGSGNPITIKKHYNDFQEALYLAEKIKEMVAGDSRYNDIGIFYRKQCMAQSFEQVFETEGIPYEKSLRKNIRDIPVLHWFICLLKSCMNPHDSHSLNTVLLDDHFGPFPNKTAMKKALETPDREHPLISRIQTFTQTDVALDDLYDYFDLDKALKPNSADYEENKDYIVRFIEKFKAYWTTSTLDKNAFIKEFINNATLYGAQIIDERLNMDQDSVKLMTLHASKGLEFKHVFISGANDGIIPMLNHHYDYDNEEMRLFFVGITRAKDKVEISYHISPTHGGHFALSAPSRFIDMIPDSLKRLVDQVAKPVDFNQLIQKIRNKRKQQTEEKPVPKVRHEKYGVGKLVSKENGRITVDFEDYGEKKFMEDFVKLEYL